MKARELKKGIYWVGGIDWDLRNFHGYVTQRGTTYNAYLIIDEKIVLIDTVKHYLYDEMFSRIKSIIDPAKIDYIVSNHVEMDHSGCLPKIMKVCKNATVITSPNGEKGLKKHYDVDWKLQVVQTKDSINIGKRNLSFVLIPMVHWPDSMVTYIPEEKILFPNDAFGQHFASEERFDEEVPYDIINEEAAKYYANIVLPFSGPVNNALAALSNIPLEMIAPSHGIIWKKHINDIVSEYKKWANNEVENKAAVIFDTMWDSTRKIAYRICEAFEEKGIYAKPFCLRNNDISDVMTYILTSKYICIGSPTLNNGVLPTVASFLCYLKGLSPQKRIGLSFGSYGWGGQSIGEIEAVLKAIKCEMLNPIKCQYIPTDSFLKDIKL